jgi:hypothetical protein
MATHLPDILVPDPADLLNVGRALRDVLERVARKQELVLLGLGDLGLNTLAEDDLEKPLLADEVAAHPSAVCPSCCAPLPRLPVHAASAA